MTRYAFALRGLPMAGSSDLVVHEKMVDIYSQ